MSNGRCIEVFFFSYVTKKVNFFYRTIGYQVMHWQSDFLLKWSFTVWWVQNLLLRYEVKVTILWLSFSLLLFPMEKSNWNLLLEWTILSDNRSILLVHIRSMVTENDLNVTERSYELQGAAHWTFCAIKRVHSDRGIFWKMFFHLPLRVSVSKTWASYFGINTFWFWVSVSVDWILGIFVYENTICRTRFTKSATSENA